MTLDLPTNFSEDPRKKSLMLSIYRYLTMLVPMMRTSCRLQSRGSIGYRLIPSGTAIITLITIGFLLSACVRMPTRILSKPSFYPSEPKPLALHPITYEELPGWETDRHGAILPVFLKSCQKITEHPPDRDFGSKAEMGKVHHWISLCRDANRIDPSNHSQVRHFIENRFTAHAIEFDGRQDGLFTGYYEPELRGAVRPDAQFSYPILGRPDDLINVDLGHFNDKWRNRKIVGRLHEGTLVPYYNRTQIESGALNHRRLELLWVDDPIDVFFLHIQGSGRVRLPDGSSIRLGYAGRNGWPYTAIGRELVAEGKMTLEEVSMPTIRRWIEANPTAGLSLMRKNQAYIFFKIQESAGPIGSQGVVLTPERSLAVDSDYTPLGALLWLSTNDPGTKPARKLRRLVVAQDTGSAISGAIRGDLFWGYGKRAAEKAGVMKEIGRYYILLPRAASVSI
uniref:Membrane-bound lytic murein transglycosylase A n=1 Tax=Candidatus Kentrum sp. TUN TaxID=2126343 RepID=A0A450ZZN0_9GAMM|nr:MAG: membrane-bound lytic murein transglycosylase A [Candidatus Kentron sp. TUN]VFK62750.1 MAG: membrane-bound lytic murein transglycosylase A [Candidatus Kentron sp. TUN]VFK67824.1 MAG: membrane-bound lytic murein transglycosylase A [Candidatus Kentron sp. TUN]